MVIAGHRGGFKPFNSMHNFKLARDNQLQAIELDVWLTKDNEIAVIHGGTEGNMPSHVGTEDTNPLFIYELTLEEARKEFAKSGDYKDSF